MAQRRTKKEGKWKYRYAYSWDFYPAGMTVTFPDSSKPGTVACEKMMSPGRNPVDRRSRRTDDAPTKNSVGRPLAK
jgi:hypothetical protein